MANNGASSGIFDDINSLVGGCRSVLMATSSEAGLPEISYSPFVVVDGELYVFISDLAVHTGNLKENPRASLLFIEDEEGCENIHARRRVTFRAIATVIERDAIGWQDVLAEMEGRFGEIVPLLKSLPDFHLFAMQADTVTVVRGFADAHTVDCTGFPQT